MDLKELAAQLITQHIGAANDQGAAAAALNELVGGGKGFDIGELVGQFTGSGGDLAAMAKSWLGDGANDSMSASQVQQALGSDKIAAFARQLGISADEANSGLARILPQLIDKSSRGGELLDSLGGADKLAGMASKLFG